MGARAADPGGRRNCDWRSRPNAVRAAPARRWRQGTCEQPGSRHSKPASMKIRSRPSASASRLTISDPGTTQAWTRGIDLAAAHHLGGGLQIRQAAVGAGADEDPIDRRAGDGGAGLQSHVVQCALHRLAAILVGDAGRIGNASVDRDDVFRAGAPGDLRRDPADVDQDLAVVCGAGIARQSQPGVDGAQPQGALGRVAAGLRGRRRSSRPGR